MMSILDQDALSCIVQKLRRDRLGNLTIVGFLLARSWRATCKAFLVASRATPSLWDGQVTEWVDLGNLPNEMAKYGYDDHCNVRQGGYANKMPKQFKDGLLIGSMPLHQIVDEDGLSLEFRIDEKDQTPEKSKYCMFLHILRDVQTDRILILNVHGDALHHPTRPNFAFDIWDVDACVRMFNAHSSDADDQVPFLAQGLSGKRHQFTTCSVDRAAARQIPIIRFIDDQDNPDYWFAALALKFWVYTGKANKFDLMALTREGKTVQVKRNVVTNRLVFLETEIASLKSDGNIAYHRRCIPSSAPSALLCWPGVDLNSVPLFYTACGFYESPQRLNVSLGGLLHCETWMMPSELRTHGYVDLDRRLEEEGDYSRLRQSLALEEEEEKATKKAKNATAIMIAIDSDEECETPPHSSTSLKRYKTRRNPETTQKVKTSAEGLASTLESGRMPSSLNDEPPTSGLIDDQFVDEDDEEEEKEWTAEYEQQLEDEDEDWGTTKKEASSSRTKIVIAISDDEDDLEDDFKGSSSSANDLLEQIKKNTRMVLEDSDSD